MSDEIPECHDGNNHRWSEPELADIEWGERHDTVRVRLACGECECIIERTLYADRNYDRWEELILPPLAFCEHERCGRPIWKEGYENHGDYYCMSSYEGHECCEVRADRRRANE